MNEVSDLSFQGNDSDLDSWQAATEVSATCKQDSSGLTEQALDGPIRAPASDNLRRPHISANLDREAFPTIHKGSLPTDCFC